MSETSSHKNAKTRGLSGSKTEVQIRGNRWLDARGHRNALLDKPAEKISPTQTKLARCGTSFFARPSVPFWFCRPVGGNQSGFCSK